MFLMKVYWFGPLIARYNFGIGLVLVIQEIAAGSADKK